MRKTFELTYEEVIRAIALYLRDHKNQDIPNTATFNLKVRQDRGRYAMFEVKPG